MDRPAIVDRHRAGRAHEVLGGVEGDLAEVPVGKASDPLTLVVVLVEKLPLVATGDDSQRTLVRSHVVEIGTDRQGAVVGVRPVLDVLVPLDLFAPLGPFEIELRVVKLDVRSNEVGDDVGDDRLGGVFPVAIVVFHGAGQAAEPRVVRSVARFKVEHRIGLRDRAAPFHPFGGHRPHLLHHLGGNDALHQQVTVVEVELPLLLGEDAGWDLENLFRSHVRRLRVRSGSSMFDPVLHSVNRRGRWSREGAARRLAQTRTRVY